MTDRIGPFDTANFTQDQWYRSAKMWAPSGVFGSPAASASSGGLAMTTSGLAVTIGTGTGLSRGSLFDRDAAATVSGGTLNGNASLYRMDRIVLRRDLAAKTCAPMWLTGSPSATPTAPALTQVDTGVWDTPLFSFLVPPNNGTAISGIVDERGWIDALSPGLVAFASTAARDAYFPNAGDSALCMVGDVLYEHSGGAWKSLTQAAFRGSTYTSGGITSGTANVTLVTIPITITARDVADGRRIMVHVRGTWGSSSNLRVAPLRDGAAFDPNWQEINPGPGNTSWFWIGTVADATAGSHTITVYFRSISSGSAVSAGPVSAYVELI